MPILVVDDFETMAKAVAGLLRKLGFTSVDIALNGGTALQKLRKKSYDLVISD
jgi:CheY-like chemotaxis protein